MGSAEKLIVFAIYPHFLGNRFSLRKDFSQIQGSEHVSQRGGGQKSCGAAVVVDVGHRVHRICHLVVHDRVHKHRHAVLGQDLEQVGYHQKWGVQWRGTKKIIEIQFEGNNLSFINFFSYRQSDVPASAKR